MLVWNQVPGVLSLLNLREGLAGRSLPTPAPSVAWAHSSKGPRQHRQRPRPQPREACWLSHGVSTPKYRCRGTHCALPGQPQTGRSPNPHSSLGNGEPSSHIPGQAATRAAESRAQGGFAQHRAPKRHKSGSPPRPVWGTLALRGRAGAHSRQRWVGDLNLRPFHRRRRFVDLKHHRHRPLPADLISRGSWEEPFREAARQWSALSGARSRPLHAALQVFPAGL